MKNTQPILWPAVRDAIQRSGLTHQEIADRAGITRPMVTLCLSGRKNPSVATLEALARAAGYEFRLVKIRKKSRESP